MRIMTAARAAWKRIDGLLASRRTSFALMGGWIALLAVWLAPFQLAGQPEKTIGSIAVDWAPFRAVYVLLALSTVFITYVVSGFLAHPDWGEAAKGLAVPSIPLTRDAVLIAVATCVAV